MNVSNQSQRGFTLIEILIVVVILGILAGIVVGQFQTTTASSNASAAKSSLKVVRSQIELYRYSHGTPTSVDVLVNNGNLASTPVSPEGFQYV
ncbi:MAG: type II secretion system protein, partial [Phycisphaerales bacterium]